jgi:xylan 1,4-beta-xylosidase
MPRVANPVLPGFYPDPSILRVGDEYFIANSTFEWYPGVELHRSKDLVTWESIPSPLSEKRLLDMDGADSSCGIWAPCLSYADGLFWLIFTNVRSYPGRWKDTPNYLTTASSIEGPWSDPVFLNCSGFDPSLFHEDDGRKWLINMEWDYRYASPGSFTGLLLQEYLPKEGRLGGPIRKIFNGSGIGKIEGPHLYKRNGWYYVMAAEGGTEYGHAATVARSRSLFGPYELHPSNPLITSYGRPGLALQKAGHASWCDTPDGSRYYMAFLCGRPLPGTELCVLGRETSIVEITWKDDWPYVLHEDGALFEEGLPRNYPAGSFEPPVIKSEYAKAGSFPPATRSVEYRFDGPEIHGDFKSLRTERPAGAYSLTARPGWLRMRGGMSPVSRYGQTLLARRQTDFSFDAETRVDFAPTSFQQLAGLAWRYDEENQYLAVISRDEERGRVLFVMTMKDRVFERSLETKLPDEGPVWLGLSVRVETGSFRWSLDGERWNLLRPALDSGVLSDEHGGIGFTGAFVGMFCADTESYAACADFDRFSYAVR